jgi:hypothetical protein
MGAILTIRNFGSSPCRTICATTESTRSVCNAVPTKWALAARDARRQLLF